MSDRSENPYVAPEAEMESSSDEFAETGIITAKGRLGRLRYIAYGTGFGFVAGILQVGLMVVVSLLGAGASEIIIGAAAVVIGVGYLALYVFWTIRRLHDFNLSGWFTFIFILPVINFALWLIPGIRGENNHGPMQPPNTLGVRALALIMPVVVLFVILSIALPFNHGHNTIRSRVQEGTNLSMPARTALGIACSEGDLANQTDNDLLGLAGPSAYGANSRVVKSVAAAGLSDTSGQVTITLRAIGSAIPENAQIIYRGECSSSGMTWTVTGGGGMPPKHLPRT